MVLAIHIYLYYNMSETPTLPHNLAGLYGIEKCDIKVMEEADQIIKQIKILVGIFMLVVICLKNIKQNYLNSQIMKK